MRRVPLLLALLVGLGVGGSACGGGSSETAAEATTDAVTTTTPPTSSTEGETDSDDDAGSAPTTAGTEDPTTWWPVPLDQIDPASPASWTVEVLDTAPHDEAAFTQGLEWLSDGRLLESTGLRGQSEVRIVEADSGDVEVAAALESEEFGEGLTVVDDTVVQLTWQEGLARRWALPGLEPLDSFEYEGEGWGLCRLGDRLAMTDGTSVLQWRDATTFELLETVAVTRAGESIAQLNELECVDGHVVANIWRSPEIVVIEPSGLVIATIDAGNLVATIDSDDPVREVLNGVAAHPDGTFSMTGKLWPTRFVVAVIER